MEPGTGKRIAKALLGCFGVTFLITGIAIAIMSRGLFADWITSKKEAIDASEVDYGELKPGSHVTLDVKVTIGAFMKHVESMRKGNSVVSSTATVYYLMPCLKDDEAGTKIEYFLAFSLGNKSDNAKRITKLDTAFSEWWNDTTGTVARPDEVKATIDGRVAKLSSKELEYLDEYFSKYLKSMDREDYIQPVVIRELWTDGTESTAVMFAIMCGVTTLLGIVMVFFALRGRKKKVPTE
ncbi:MAG: hypothetical protein J5645_08530 [Lachnospiraceae bacterium]|nr:hypothetical protein [Lachnospiraceae bacterium]